MHPETDSLDTAMEQLDWLARELEGQARYEPVGGRVVPESFAYGSASTPRPAHKLPSPGAPAGQVLEAGSLWSCDTGTASS